MTDPVDTDALRDASRRLAGVHVRGNNLAVIRARGELDAAADEVGRLRADLTESKAERAHFKAARDSLIDDVNRLRAVIENAPHREKCRPHIACTCWKADAS
ncbi:hypothetical protein [Curtobacterium sp. MCSS17_015]|uniref:hypothetical protein n=1 Tax=Curtobacterium sp. MCSS17_015 TaxID=2175666 RepID=UPI000DB16F80|nr:hypothetical protein [Curtobacterium sp. MCSS17_015]WIB25855.1 hypothetical protein DEJ18_12465 [Curtobacterium sp. MCSS17_015]